MRLKSGETRLVKLYDRPGDDYAKYKGDLWKSSLSRFGFNDNCITERHWERGSSGRWTWWMEHRLCCHVSETQLLLPSSLSKFQCVPLAGWKWAVVPPPLWSKSRLNNIILMDITINDNNDGQIIKEIVHFLGLLFSFVLLCRLKQLQWNSKRTGRGWGTLEVFWDHSERSGLVTRLDKVLSNTYTCACQKTTVFRCKSDYLS